MRMLVNAIVGLCVIALLGVIWSKSSREQDEVTRAAGAASAIRTIHQVLSYQAAFDKAPSNSRGWPITIDPAWFEGDPPRNPMVSGEHPWIEIASPAEAGLLHPQVRLAVSPTLAGLWYNPYQGVVRARVPVMISDAKSVALYNQVNGTTLASIFQKEIPLVVPMPDSRSVEAGMAPPATVGP